MVELTVIGLLRAVIAACIGVWIGASIAPLLQRTSTDKVLRPIVFALLVLSVFVPPLLTAYAYGRWSLWLVHHPTMKEFAYIGYLVLRVSPVVALLHFFFPSVTSASPDHSIRLARSLGGPTAGLWKVWFRLQVGQWLFPAAVAAFVAFHEFEIASLLAVEAWTVKLFDAHAGGLPLSDSVRLATIPCVVQLGLAFVVTATWVRGGGRRSGTTQTTPIPEARRSRMTMGLVVVALTSIGTVLLPIGLIAGDGLAGFGQMSRAFVLEKELLATAVFAAGSGGLAFVCSWALSTRMLGFLSVFGLLGPLVNALAMVAIFQAAPLLALYDSPVPLMLALTILAFPVAFICKILRSRTSESESAWIARRSRSSWPSWVVIGRPAMICLLLLCVLASFELTASAILAPPGMTTISSRLYNLMHYGETAVLSAMTITAFALPVAGASALWALLEIAAHLIARRSLR